MVKMKHKRFGASYYQIDRQNRQTILYAPPYKHTTLRTKYLLSGAKKSAITLDWRKKGPFLRSFYDGFLFSKIVCLIPCGVTVLVRPDLFHCQIQTYSDLAFREERLMRFFVVCSIVATLVVNNTLY